MSDRGDRIVVRGLRVEARHGVLAHEKVIPQPFLVDIELTVDVSAAGTSDELADTVSYADIAHDAAAVLGGPPADLIEHLAERVADAALARPGVQDAAVTVHKPHAPIGLPVADAAVTVRRTRRATAVIGLGGNLSAPEARLADAVRRLAAHPDIDPLVLSPLLESDPVGGPPGQPSYANAVLNVATSLSPVALLRALQAVEAAHGRRRDVRWGPRTLDLDLLAYVDPRLGGEVRTPGPDCILPHPRAGERAFVVLPWLLTDPTAELPRTALPALLASVSATASGPGSDQAAADLTPDPAPADVTPEPAAADLTPDPTPADLTPEPAAADLTPEQLAALGVRRGPEWPSFVTALVLVAPW